MNQVTQNKTKIVIKMFLAWYIFSSLLLGQVFIYTWVNMVFFDMPVRWVGNVFQADTDLKYLKDQIQDINESIFDLKRKK